MRSLHQRLQWTAALVLLSFIAITALALEQAFRDSARTSMEDRLTAQLYLLMAATEVDEQGRLRMPQQLTEPRLMLPASGLYARIDGVPDRHWRSPSLLGTEFSLVALGTHHEPGRHFDRVPADGTELFIATLWVNWETSQQTLPLGFSIAEDARPHDAQLAGYRRQLWAWLGGMAILLLLALGAALAWGLRPLRRVAGEIRAIENGRQQGLHGDYPQEIRQLSDNINTLLQHERAQQARYQHALGDLAHSLKTPLAVLRSLPERTTLMDEQIQRMDHIVQYQLQRAATAGRSALATPVAVDHTLTRLLTSLQKVYAERSISVDKQLVGACRFHGDEGDLLELLGNLLDNAFKWARANIRIHAKQHLGQLHISIEDDGPGIAQEQIEQVLKRGARLDEATPGHGIGMAMVRDIVEAYQGELRIEGSELGGTAIHLILPNY